MAIEMHVSPTQNTRRTVLLITRVTLRYGVATVILGIFGYQQIRFLKTFQNITVYIWYAFLITLYSRNIH
jgi:hypothetical protein